jgi:hypothetical protein
MAAGDDGGAFDGAADGWGSPMAPGDGGADGGALDGAADLAAVDIFHLCVCRHDDGNVGIGVEVKTADFADFAKNAEITADFADFAKIAKISQGEIRQVEQMAEIKPVIILRDGLVLRPHTEIAVRGKCVEVAVQEHRERNL